MNLLLTRSRRLCLEESPLFAETFSRLLESSSTRSFAPRPFSVRWPSRNSSPVDVTIPETFFNDPCYMVTVLPLHQRPHRQALVILVFKILNRSLSLSLSVLATLLRVRAADFSFIRIMDSLKFRNNFTENSPKAYTTYFTCIHYYYCLTSLDR